jgi:hypothetical protein
MPKTLQTLDNLVLVLREHTGETVRVHDHLVQARVLAAGRGAVLEHLGGVHVVAEAETTSSFLGDSELEATVRMLVQEKGYRGRHKPDLR